MSAIPILASLAEAGVRCAWFMIEIPSVFRLPKGGFHATSFSCCCSLSQFYKN
jgi:hypothetical protein